jgi:hypothetical protein
MGRTSLITIEMLAVSVWVGSLVCLAIVAKVARDELDEVSRVTLFRRIGRVYGVIGTGSLLVAIGVGTAIAWPLSQLGNAGSAMVVLTATLVLLTAAGLVQARRMTVRRRLAISAPDDEHAVGAVRRGAVLAGALRGSMALLTLATLVLGAHVLSR